MGPGAFWQTPLGFSRPRQVTSRRTLACARQSPLPPTAHSAQAFRIHLQVLNIPGAPLRVVCPRDPGSKLELWPGLLPASLLCASADALDKGLSQSLRDRNPIQSPTAMPGRLEDSLRFRLINRFFWRKRRLSLNICVLPRPGLPAPTCQPTHPPPAQ